MVRRIRACHRACRPQEGQALVLLVLVLTVLLGMAAVVIDVGYAYYVQRSLQASTDAAALAGAQQLPISGAALSVARDYSGMPGARTSARVYRR